MALPSVCLSKRCCPEPRDFGVTGQGGMGEVRVQRPLSRGGRPLLVW